MKKNICFLIDHKINTNNNRDGYYFCERCNAHEYYDNNEITNNWNNTIPNYLKYYAFLLQNFWYNFMKNFKKEELPF